MPIGANNVIFKTDKSKCGKLNYYRGHRVEGVWVFGMVVRSDSRRLVMIAIG